MDNANSTRQSEPALLTMLRRSWRLLTAPPVPDYQPVPGIAPDVLRLRELERVLDLLEQTKIRVAERGWAAGGWFRVPATVRQPAHLAGRQEAMQLLQHPAAAGGGCLVGTMLLLAEDQDTAHSLADVWRATDELYEAMHEREGHVSFPPGHRCSPAERHHQLRALTFWNDEPGRSKGDVVDLLNQGIARTIVACVS